MNKQKDLIEFDESEVELIMTEADMAEVNGGAKAKTKVGQFFKDLFRDNGCNNNCDANCRCVVVNNK